MYHDTPAVDILVDGHVHTRFCRHAVGEMEDYVRAAIGKGLREICFLEHMESGISYPERTWLTEADFDAYFAEGRRLQQTYREKIAIGLGVEVGYNPEYCDELRERLAGRQWSRIGLSFHYARIPGDQDHLNLVSRKAENIRRAGEFGAERLLNGYVEVLLKAVQDLPATVLCHLDAALRSSPRADLVGVTSRADRPTARGRQGPGHGGRDKHLGPAGPGRTLPFPSDPPHGHRPRHPIGCRIGRPPARGCRPPFRVD